MAQGSASQHGRILIASLALVSLAMIGATTWYYLRQRTEVEASAIQELSAIATIKAAQLVNWRRERLGDGGMLQTPAIARSAERALSMKSIQPGDRADLLDAMQDLERHFLYTGAALVDRDGRIRLQANTSSFDPQVISDLGKAASGSTAATLQDFYWDTKLGRPLMALTVPIQGLGAFVLTIDPDRFLYPFMQLWPGATSTGETVLVRREGNRVLYLSGLRHRPGTALHFWRPVTKRRSQAQLNSSWVFNETDYRGVYVLGTIRAVPGSPWHLIAKMDVSEVDAPLTRLGWEMALIIALIAFANMAGTGFIWRNRQMRIFREREEWEREMANGTPALLWLTAPDGRGMFINRSLAEFVGGGQQQQLRGTWRAYLHPDDAERVAKTYYECVAKGAEFLEEHRVRRFDGEYRWFIARGLPSVSDRTGTYRYCGSLFDITERRVAEQRARESAELLEAQNRVLELIIRNRPLGEILEALALAIEELAPEMMASILLLDEQGEHLLHGAAPSLPESYSRAISGEPIGPKAGSCGAAAFSREPVYVEDIETDPLWEQYRELALRHGLRACWSTPILEEKSGDDQRVLGTFALYFRTPGLPGPRQRELIDMATQTAAIAIVRTRESEALRKSEERLRLATAAGSLAIWEWQIVEGRFTASNGLTDLFRFPPAANDVTLEMVLERIHPADRERVRETLNRAITERIDYDSEYRVRLNDGTVRWIASQGRAQYDSSGTALRILGVSRDVTSRKQAEEDINRRDMQLLEAQRIAHVGSYEWDLRARRIYRSAELIKMLDLEPGDFETNIENYFRTVHPDDRDSAMEAFQRALDAGEPFDKEERIVRRDGTIRVMRCQGQWVCEEGKPVKLVGTFQDITDRKQAEEQLRAANAALAEELKERARTEKEIKALSARLINAHEEERTRLARELHDDLSQQIAALSIGVSNLKRGIPAELDEARLQSERIREKLANLAASTRRLSHELHPAILQHCGLDVALRALCSDFGALAAIKVSFQGEGYFEDVPPNISLCAYRVAQEALQNVVKHAGTDQAAVSLVRSADGLTLEVTDYGVGMDCDRVRTGGGLGLTSIRERARLVNGSVDIRSDVNRGTTVELRIPVMNAESQPLTLIENH